jgi:Xaa-Pro aminopeptidase
MIAQATIPKVEFERRWQTAQERMAELDLDVLLVHSHEADPSNVRYLADYWPLFETAGVALGRSGDPILLIGPETLTYAQDRSAIPNILQILEYRESAEPEYPGKVLSTFEEAVGTAAGGGAVRRIGIAGMSIMPVTVYRAIQRAAGAAELVRADEILTGMRAIKSEHEIALMREAFRISEIATADVLREMKPGMTEQEVVGIAQRSMYANGAEYEAHPQYVLSGRNSSHAIGRPSTKVLQEGELIQLNIGARVGGYTSSVGRPVCFGRMPTLVRELVTVGLEAHHRTVELMKAGVPAKEAVLGFEAFIADKGYTQYLLYGPCHAIGLMEVEPPWMESNSQFPLQENMTFQVDTFLYTTDFGLRWENGVRVTASGVEMLSRQRMEVLEL